MAKEICQDCERVFETKSGKVYFCPECVKARLSASAKRRGLNSIGNEAYSRQQSERKAKWKDGLNGRVHQ